MIVGSQARILYADGAGRERIALALNAAIRDGSSLTADMAVHNVIGDAFRGATWVSLHNGGGVGWGEAVNGGFGMVIDGSVEADERISRMIPWDVNHGMARRAWARNGGAESAIRRAMQADARMRVTMPEHADAELVAEALRRAGMDGG